MITILVADDHPIIRKGLKQIISEERDMEVVGEASNGKEVLEKVKKLNPSVIILDISMPGYSGLYILSQLKSLYPKLPVLMLSALSEQIYASQSLKAGASGFVNKESVPEELVKAIRKVSGGELYIGSVLAEQMAHNLRHDKKSLPHELLSFREFQVLRLIASGKQSGEIAKELNISIKTVSTYRSRVLEKLDMTNNAELVNYCYREGLIDNFEPTIL
ncbi:MAG: response regulator transcription factor [Bacteroidota bacterium]|nr:response regulator transcription factor [Bacteroidota bacterium]